ncbi:NAD(P)H nitroreductase [Alteromonas pelagimontana]|uniref:Putative NAD(P)H nitroreductase n=1 Tax=Alteromonas pelagimontana TaxID=1858656 RepID=A0A6M4MH33_9ALTE|nr:NAD(P)H nitroreductase [Alteromonas pelagimontana]QJR82429.1 NAD(P)H nitroreductase [Alteromonas pelagimontana]
MDALELLLHRRSQPRLKAPAPKGEVLENIMQAALRAPDHAALTPWRFIICEESGLQKLGALFEQSAIDNGKSEKEIERAPQLPLRAPMVIVAIAKYTENAKVPRIEQVASASCAVMAMQMAAIAQGFNGIWRSGAYAQCDVVREGLRVGEEDEIVGFLYLGTPAFDTPIAPARNSADYFERLI